MNENKKISEEKFQRLTALMFNLPYQDEFRRVKVKTKELDIFLKEVAEGEIEDSKEFLREGLKRTITPLLLSIIKEKLRRFAEKYRDNPEGEAALMVLHFLYNSYPLDTNAFFIVVFIRSALNRPLADNSKVWAFLYEFLPKKIETGDTETVEKPKFKNISGKDFEEKESGLLTPKEKRLEGKTKPRIVIPGGGNK
ncbi:hypothetical protein JW879_07435 [candidate division WOR-3 bacterium]|nr:hypothetical protein [candidate division WOR-3 bacterium]